MAKKISKTVKSKSSHKDRIPPIEGEKSFYTSINKAIARGEHVQGLKQIIKEYEDYKSYMSGVFEKSEPAYQDIFKFRVEYLMKKPVWRVFEVEGCQSFEEFSNSIIDSMGWANDHLHAFYFPEFRNGHLFQYSYSPYGIYSQHFEDEQHPTYHSNNIRITEIDYAKYPRLNYIFDFGDGHQFSVKFISRRKSEKADEMSLLPKIIDQRGVGPDQYPQIFENEAE
jgi:hypothetical protein